MSDRWMDWAMRIQGIAQSGREYSPNKYDLDRYRQLQDLSAEILSTYSDHDFNEVRVFLESEVGYATPKVDVRGVVFQEKQVLLVRETVDNRWSLPGGWADIQATPSENVVREIREESGYLTRASRLLAVYDRRLHHDTSVPYPYSIYKMFFLCELTGGSPTTSIETSDVGFFGLDDLPELSVGRTTEKQIRRMAELKESGGTDFD